MPRGTRVYDVTEFFSQVSEYPSEFAWCRRARSRHRQERGKSVSIAADQRRPTFFPIQ